MLRTGTSQSPLATRANAQGHAAEPLVHKEGHMSNPFLTELAKAVAESEELTETLPGPHLQFLRRLVNLRSHQDYLNLIDEFEFGDDELDAVKGNIDGLKETATQAAKWVSRVSIIPAIIGEGDNFI